MIICNTCGKILDPYNLKRVLAMEAEYMGETVREYEAVCPYCRDNDFDEVYECDDCGGYFRKLHMINGYEFCPDCLEKYLRLHSDSVTRWIIHEGDLLDDLQIWLDKEVIADRLKIDVEKIIYSKGRYYYNGEEVKVGA